MEIIKACAESGVSHFIFGELEFVLPHSVEDEITKIASVSRPVVNLDDMSHNKEDSQDEVPADPDEQMILDPLGFEKQMLGETDAEN